MISIKSYPADNGDAFLIKVDGGQPQAVLVDGGYASTFNQYILPDLVALASSGYALDLVVATHIDADHISGLLRFFKANGDARAPKIISVHQVFYNSLRSLAVLGSSTVRANVSDEELLQEILRRGYPLTTAEALAESEISARQGSCLAALLKAGVYPWNQSEGRMSINGNAFPSFPLGAGSVTIIGPPVKRLEGLLAWWTSEIRRLGFTGVLNANDQLDDAFELMCAEPEPKVAVHAISGSETPNLELKDCYVPDDSITNASSITFILETDGCRMLFLGDATAEDCEAALRDWAGSNKQLMFDAIKISHHGSLRNTSPSLLELVDARRFFISSNGESHNHPDFEVLKAIVDRQGNSRELFLNYPTPASQRLKSYASKSGVGFIVREGITDWVSFGN